MSLPRAERPGGALTLLAQPLRPRGLRSTCGIRRQEDGGAGLRCALALAVLAAPTSAVAANLRHHVPANASVGEHPHEQEVARGRRGRPRRQRTARASARSTSMHPRTDRADRPLRRRVFFALDLKKVPLGPERLIALKPADISSHLDSRQADQLATGVDRDQFRTVLGRTRQSVDPRSPGGLRRLPRGPRRASRRSCREQTSTSARPPRPSPRPGRRGHRSAVVQTIRPKV